MAVRTKLTVALTLVLLGATARPARADWDFQMSASMGGGWLRETPEYSTEPISTFARDIGEGRVKSRGGIAMVGLGMDTELVVDDRWKVPTVGANVYWAVGSYPTLVSSLDGSIIHLRPWTTWRGDILLPGIGRRWKHRRYMVEASIRTGVSWLQAGASVASGGERVELTGVQAVTFLVQAEVVGCRRLDPTTRVCIQLMPRLYEHRWLNGGTIGLRMEWGR